MYESAWTCGGTATAYGSGLLRGRCGPPDTDCLRHSHNSGEWKVVVRKTQIPDSIRAWGTRAVGQNYRYRQVKG